MKRQILLSLLVLSLSACGGSGGGNKNGGGFVPPPPGTLVTVSGVVSYEFVPANLNCSGLNFSATEVRPIRGATVVLLNNTGGEMARTTSSASGQYSFAGLAQDTSVQIRVLAESKSSGLANWDVEVRDNVDTSGAPPPLGSRPMYSIESSGFSTGNSDVTRNLTAETGWDLPGNSYTTPRAAAPFAVLDTIYSGMQFIAAVDPDISFPPLDVFWSVNNTIDLTAGLPDPDTGELGGSFYVFGLNSVFLTGDATSDTSEFDNHVVGHEWGHFLDDTIFRSDSPGGTHFLGDRLDSRLAWGEGWPSALAAMFIGNPSYCQTGVPGTNEGFEINAEAGFFGGQGWFDEVGITRFVYDLWDTDVPGSDGTDDHSVGFAPIYDVMTGGQINTPAWTNIYTFAVELKILVDANGDALIDSQLGDEQTVQGAQLDIWGTNETNDGGANDPADVLPMYIDMVPDDVPTEICSDSQFDFRVETDGNKISEFRYIRLNVQFADEYDVVIASTTPTPPTPDTTDRDQSDPDMYILQNGALVLELTSGDENLETGTTPMLQPGTYIADLRDWRYADFEKPASYPPRVCFDVSFNSTP